MRIALAALLLALATAGCSSVESNPTPERRVAAPATSAATASSTTPPAPSHNQPDPSLDPSKVGFKVRPDGSWEWSGGIVVVVKDGLAQEVRSADSSLRCWDIRFATGVIPDPLQALYFYQGAVWNKPAPGTTETRYYTMDGVKVGTFTCSSR